MFTTYCPPEDVAAVIVEPIFGDMGWVIPPDEYFTGLKTLCEKYGIYFIVAYRFNNGIYQKSKRDPQQLQLLEQLLLVFQAR